MLSTGDFKRGAHILVEGQPYTIEDYTVQSPSARGASTLIRTKLRHIVEGRLVERTFKGGDKFDQPDVAFRQVQFLYADDDSCHFMDVGSYEQFTLPLEQLGDDAPWLVEGLQLSSVVLEERVVGVSLPQYVELEVTLVGAGSKSDTASGRNLKDATLSNGETIKVPLFIEIGERIFVDPRTREYAKRA